jgi:SAM-dependent methyltransferase
MRQAINSNIVKDLPWFKTWFSSPYYHSLYIHRNDEEARKFIDALLFELRPPQNSVLLDVGCGNGRHSKYLASQGFIVAGFDTSRASIKEAQKLNSPTLTFFQHDMRVPFGKNRFDYVFNFFTSFGYFSRSENLSVLENMQSALKAGGRLVIDYLNVAFAVNSLVESEEKEIDGINYVITRWHDEDFIYKKISIDDVNLPAPLEFTEQVSKLTINDFENLFHQAGLKLEAAYGDYELTEYRSTSSARLVMIIKK